MAVGVPGSGTRALVDQLLKANGVTMDNGLTRGNTEIVAIGGDDAVAP
jgi:molybdate-binding protein